MCPEGSRKNQPAIREPSPEPGLLLCSCFYTSLPLGGTAPKSDLLGKRPTEARVLGDGEGRPFVHPLIHLTKMLSIGNSKLILTWLLPSRSLHSNWEVRRIRKYLSAMGQVLWYQTVVCRKVTRRKQPTQPGGGEWIRQLPTKHQVQCEDLGIRNE